VQGNLFKTDVFVYTLASNIQMIYGLLFFLSLLLSADYYVNRYTKLGIAYSIGVIIFNAGTAICFSLAQYIKVKKIFMMGMPAYNAIPKLLCIILY
ncbi:hypothetical protein ABTP95_19825, partial [Acinetobacter baumannii]